MVFDNDAVKMMHFVLDVAERLNECGYPMGPVVKVEEAEYSLEYFTAALADRPKVTMSFFYPTEYYTESNEPTCCVNFKGDGRNFMCCDETSNMNRIMMNVGMCIVADDDFAIKNS